MRSCSIQSRYFRLLGKHAILASLFFGAGCSSTAVPISDSHKAKQLFEEAMGEWKSGSKLQDLAKRTPPVFVSEDLWRNGQTLVNHALIGEPEMRGSNVRIQASLKLISKQGKEVEQKFWYQVTTVPALTIAREER
jgi:hypothetical protein